MNIKRHQYAIDFIHILMRFIPAYLFIAILLYYFDSLSAFHAVVFLPAPIISYLIRKHTRHVWSFLTLHAVMLTIYLAVISDIYYILAAVIYLIILTIVAYYRRNNENKLENTSALLLIPVVMLYIACYFTGMAMLQQICFILSVVYVLLYMLNKYLLNLERFAFNHEGMTNIPFHQITNSNNVMIGFLSGLFLVVMIVFAQVPLDRLIISLGKQFIRLLRYLISLIQFKEPEEIPEPEEEDVMIEDYPLQEPSRLMEIISEILQWVAVILMILFVVTVVLYTLYQIYQYFYLKSEETIKDKIEFLSPFVQRERMKREHKKRLGGLFGRSNNALIRRYFTRAVAANLTPDEVPDKSLTPSQLSGYILKEEDIDDLQNRKNLITGYYEKARYSDEPCTREEVRFLKKLLREKSAPDRRTH